MFQPRFSAKVRARIQLLQVTFFPLREWWGTPYRSKQRILRETFCSHLYQIQISGRGISLDGVTMCADGIAKGDGFADFDAMLKWFKDTHGLPFQGVLIEWPKK